VRRQNSDRRLEIRGDKGITVKLSQWMSGIAVKFVKSSPVRAFRHIHGCCGICLKTLGGTTHRPSRSACLNRVRSVRAVDYCSVLKRKSWCMLCYGQTLKMWCSVK
jgi:hypothetical protein